MKKILIGLLVVMAVVLSACSLNTYTGLSDNSSSTNISVNDSFQVVDDTSVSETSDNQDLAQNVEDSDVLTTFTVHEGDLVSLKDLYAIDPDGDSVSYSYETPFNAAGLWQTNEGDEGKYLTTITASDGMLTTSEQVQIVVLPSNKPPVIECDDSYSFTEGDFIQLPCVIYDKEGDHVDYTVSGFMDSLSYQTTFDDSGDHLVVVSATDGNRVSTKEINISIANVNRAPVLNSAELAPINATELDTISLDIEVSDPDGDELSITYPPQFDNDGVWVPQQGDAGDYNLSVIVSDGESEITLPLTIHIEKVNLPPVFEPIGDLTYNEGDFIALPINITDEDEVIVTYSGYMNSRTHLASYDDAGVYEETVVASDSANHTVTQTFTITILNVNRPPEFVDNE